MLTVISVLPWREFILQQTEENDPEVTVEYYTNEEGQRVKKITQKQRKVVTTIHKESVERFETTVIE